MASGLAEAVGRKGNKVFTQFRGIAQGLRLIRVSSGRWLRQNGEAYDKG
jgi:hypothetical protein